MKQMIDRASSRGFFDHGWLQTYHTFSFADYHNPERMRFGALRVLNDDVIAPGRGFDMHPHRNMEVITIPLKGYLTHGDSIENEATITPGDIQVMSTGTGMYHREYNGSDSEALELLQIWVFPRDLNYPPSYANYDIRPLLHVNELSLILSPDLSTAASIRQDAWFSLGYFDRDEQCIYRLHQGNTGVYLFLIEGRATVNGETLERRDGIGLWEIEQRQLDFTVEKGTRLLLMEVPVRTVTV